MSYHIQSRSQGLWKNGATQNRQTCTRDERIDLPKSAISAAAFFSDGLDLGFASLRRVF
jgi:hypothetical protein